MEFDLFHTPEAIDLTTGILDYFFFKNRSIFEKKKKGQKLHIFLNNICRHSLSVLSNRSRAVLQSTHLYSKKTANRSEIPPCLLFLMC